MNDSKTSRRHSSRLICRVVRRWESARGPADGQTWIAERHMETCDACQAFFSEDAAFEEMMRGAARVETSTAFAAGVRDDRGLEDRILRAVRESRPETAHERESGDTRRRGISVTWSLAGAAAGVALAVVFVAQRGAAPVTTGAELASGVEVKAADRAPVGEAESSPLHWWNSLDTRRSALELAEKNPLQQEIDSISTDAQSVIGFLALNFLPTTEADKTEKPRGSAGQG